MGTIHSTAMAIISRLAEHRARRPCVQRDGIVHDTQLPLCYGDASIHGMSRYGRPARGRRISTAVLILRLNTALARVVSHWSSYSLAVHKNATTTAIKICSHFEVYACNCCYLTFQGVFNGIQLSSALSVLIHSFYSF